MSHWLEKFAKHIDIDVRRLYCCCLQFVKYLLRDDWLPLPVVSTLYYYPCALSGFQMLHKTIRYNCNERRKRSKEQKTHSLPQQVNRICVQNKTEPIPNTTTQNQSSSSRSLFESQTNSGKTRSELTANVLWGQRKHLNKSV